MNRGYTKTVSDFSTPQTVSTLTIVMPWTLMPDGSSDVLFAVANLSNTETVTVYLDTSEDASHPDTARQQSMDAGPSCQASFQVDRNVRCYFRLSCQTQAPTYNAAQVKWKLRVRTE